MPTIHELAMLRAARAAGIASRDELAHFMAQMGHESLGFTRLQESFRYTRGIDAIPVASAFREGRAALEAARAAALRGRPQALARLMYGGRMGNDDAGDGYRYRGRGFVMLTGRDNYRDAGDALGIDLLGRPELAADVDTASRIAVWYWRARVPPAQREDVSAATVAINGGSTGLRDRYDRFDAWQARLTPQFLADLDAGRVRPGAAVAPAGAQARATDGALRRFEQGGDVRALQRDLRQLDVAAGRRRPVAETGTFDAATEEAVRRFQRDRSMTVTGRVDPSLARAIRDAAVAATAAAPDAARGGAPGSAANEVPTGATPGPGARLEGVAAPGQAGGRLPDDGGDPGE